jgi:hypothetical protein
MSAIFDAPTVAEFAAAVAKMRGATAAPVA